MPEVRPERNGWRDEKISARHRQWGWDCPALDIDFLMLEYDYGSPSALIEHKHENAARVSLVHPSMQAISSLGTSAGIPFYVVRYSDDMKSWTVTPVNEIAKDKLRQSEPLTMSEVRYVSFLYYLRGRTMPESLKEKVGELA